MDLVSKVAKGQGGTAQDEKVPAGRQRRTDRRWNPEKCIPLVALAWLVAALVMTPVALLFIR